MIFINKKTQIKSAMDLSSLKKKTRNNKRSSIPPVLLNMPNGITTICTKITPLSLSSSRTEPSIIDDSGVHSSVVEKSSKKVGT